jgi:pSer/pThr/pTyr-binding forkhead associated (FHA) protein
VLLSHGVNRIGSAAEGAAVLTQAGILPVHCVIHITSSGANLQVAAGGGKVTVNGKPVTDIMGLRSGDVLAIGPVAAKFLVVEEAKATSAGSPEDDSNATRVRQAVPKFVLRGVSGAVFGKVFPITGPVVMGRAAECDISVPADEMSRRHALLRPTPEGLSVEDLGSSNGTFVNNKRVQQGFLKPNDELRLDAVRFILVAPGMEMASQQAPAPAQDPVSPSLALPAAHKVQMWASIMLTLAALAVIVLLVMKR